MHLSTYNPRRIPVVKYGTDDKYVEYDKDIKDSFEKEAKKKDIEYPLPKWVSDKDYKKYDKYSDLKK